MRIGACLLLVVLLLAMGTLVVAGARECDMVVQGMTIRIRATGEDITDRAGDHARTCLGRVFRVAASSDSAEHLRRLRAPLNL